MVELVEFVDVEDLIRRYLAQNVSVTGLSVHAGSLPAKVKPPSILVVRTGGPSDTLVLDRAQVTLECRGVSESAAAALAGAARSVLLAAERVGVMFGTPVYEVTEFSGPYFDPDAVNPVVPRYSSTYQIVVRGQSV
jgi:hypothetical protein